MKGLLLDNDIFFSALYEGHEKHQETRTWLDRTKPKGWGIAVETFLSSMRLLMNPAPMANRPLSGETAWKVLSMEIAGQNPATIVYASFLPDKDLFKEANGHKQVMDLWLVQLARSQGMVFATRDKALARNHPEDCFLLD